MDVPIAANVLGTMGAICWSVQLIPQIIINYRRHHTIGLQCSMMLLWACAGVPLGAYNICKEFNIALQIQPQILTVLSLITWIQCYHYDNEWSTSKCCATMAGVGMLFGGVEAALILALKAATGSWPVTLVGVLSTVLLSAGVLRHYWDIYSHRTVRGISFIFVGIDAAGDVFSLASVFFQPSLDILGTVIYTTEFVLWCGVFACGGYFNLVPWMRQKFVSGPLGGGNARDEDGINIDQVEAHGVSTTLSSHQLPSSTSVFQTPSAIASSHSSIRSRERTVG